MNAAIQAELGAERFERVLSMVRFEAKRILSTMPQGSIEHEELAGFGYVGLLEAWKRFDVERGITFETFARHRVRGAMLDGLRTTLGLARRRGYERLKAQIVAWQMVEDMPEGIEGQESKESAADMTFRQVADPASAFIAEDIEASRLPRPDEALEKDECKTRVRHAVEELNPEDQEVIAAVYDLEDRGDSGASLAQRRGINRSGICRRHRMILERLRMTLRVDLRV
jgi:RNA polymerase sigma factor for flagellar operon FliA